jgi:hypothetical protein
MSNDGGMDCGLVTDDAVRERRDEAPLRVGYPWFHLDHDLLFDHGLKPIDEQTSFGQRCHFRKWRSWTLTAESIAQVTLANQPRNNHTSQHYVEASNCRIPVSTCPGQCNRTG